MLQQCCELVVVVATSLHTIVCMPDFYVVHVTLPYSCHSVVPDVVYGFNIKLSLDGPTTNLGVHGFTEPTTSHNVVTTSW